jgi:hypothetical protein
VYLPSGNSVISAGTVLRSTSLQLKLFLPRILFLTVLGSGDKAHLTKLSYTNQKG